ncbi:MAG: hypothetical protein R6U44_06900 [Archaeoglobaceae archaeon]
MRKLFRIVIGLVVIVAVIGTLWMYHTNNLYEQSFTAEYRYQVDMDPGSGSGLNNVTLYVPLPSENGAGISLEDINRPDDWEVSTVDTVHGEMLEISAERIETANRSNSSPLRPGEEPQTPGPQDRTLRLNRITETIISNKEINTANPHGNEPVLNPKYDLTRTECSFPHGGDQPLKCYQYRSAMFINYGSESNGSNVSDAGLNVSVTFEGSNSWWIYGWNGNEYRDRIYFTVEGDEGWFESEGQLIAGQGSYRRT